MPGGDRTGPAGQGPMTGRGAGYCSGSAMPGYSNAYRGRGMGRAWGRGGGLGMGRAWRRGRWANPGWVDYGPGMYPPVAPMAAPTAAAYGAYAPYAPYTPSPGEELDALKQQAQMLKAELDAISGRIEELSSEA